MHDSERIALAAHLHVALRRKTGRVTDTEWMADNVDYGLAMVDLALAHAHEHMDQELARLALRFGAALTARRPSAREAYRPPPSPSLPQYDSRFRDSAPPERAPLDSRFRDSRPPEHAPQLDARFRDSRLDGRGHTRPPSDYPTSLSAAEPSEPPMPMRRGRYVGGLR